MPRQTKLTPPHKLQAFTLIIRAMGGNGADDQRASLNELYRRRLWLSPDQADLLAELRRIYSREGDPEAVTLRPVKRWTRHHDAARRAYLIEGERPDGTP